MTNYVVVRKRGNTIITTSPMPKSEAQRIAKDSRRPFMNYGSVRIRKAKSWEI